MIRLSQPVSEEAILEYIANINKDVKIASR